MSLDSFLRNLFDHGRVVVPSPGTGETPEELAASAAVLEAFEADWTLDFPGEAPAWSVDAALYGACLLYRGAQGAVFRDLGEETLRAGFDLPMPNDAEGATAQYSVDLALRFLPDLHRIVRAVSASDPLVALLDRVACRWPLSSVGVPGATPDSLGAIATNPDLMRLYVDRILAAGDHGRLDDPRVAEAARRAIGAHEELVPAVSRPFVPGSSP